VVIWKYLSIFLYPYHQKAKIQFLPWTQTNLNVKSFNSSESLLYFQANELACHSFRYPCRRNEAPGSEKNFITHNNNNSQSISMFWFSGF
jgi:hypothetical protein